MIDNIPQIDAMRMGVDYKFKVRLRGFEIFLRPLTSSENVQITSNVLKHMEGLPASARNPHTEADAHARETIKLASTTDVGKYDPQVTDPMLDRMTSDEIRFLLKEYVAVCDKVNPCLEKMKEEELKALVEDLKKNPSHLTELSFWETENVCRALIQGD